MHFRESVFGNELLTGFLNEGANPISAVTVGSLQDLGYGVNYNAVFFTPDSPATPIIGEVGVLDIEPEILDPILFLGDLGTATSPVGLGHTRISESTIYSEAQGFGWIQGAGDFLASTDQTTADGASDVTQDFITVGGADFVVDLANGAYDLQVTFGDANAAINEMQLFAENEFRSTISTLAGEFVTQTQRVIVSDGQLTIGFGGSAKVNAIGVSLVEEGDFGTGELVDLEGEFFVAIQDLSSGFVIRTHPFISAGEPLCGDGVGLVPNTSYRQWVYHVDTGNWGVSNFTAPPAGVAFDLPAIVLDSGPSGIDSDGEGLEDIVEFIIGTNPTVADTDADGVNDLAEIQQGLDALDDRGFPTGVIASLPLLGEARELVVSGNSVTGSGRTTYVATGSYGLAVIDSSQFSNPIIQGQIDLPGTAVDVGVDPLRQIAAVVGSLGVNLVNISDPMLPSLIQSIAIPGGATSVEVLDGVAYVGNNLGRVVSIDLLTGERLQTLPVGTGGVTGLARDATTLYAMTSGNQLTALDISDFQISELGSLTLDQGGGKLFAANGVVYAVASSQFNGGFSTVDVSDPTNPQLISNPDNTTALPGTDFASNGSGLGFLGGNIVGNNLLSLFNINDPSNTDNRVGGTITVPGVIQGLDIASGLGFLASGSQGLQVVNYLSFDSALLAPSVVELSSNATDVDLVTSGVQVVEGSTISLQVNVVDDVQVRNVQLLVNGVIVQNAVSFPFDFSAAIPTISEGGNTVELTVRATDTGGNFTDSEPLIFDVVPDTIAPIVVGTTPQVDQNVFFTPSIDVRFDEPLDPSLIDASGISLLQLGGDGVVGGGDDVAIPIEMVDLRGLSRRLTVLPGQILGEGNYQLTVDSSIIADRVGNQLESPFLLDFSVRPASDVTPNSGTAAIDRAPAANPGQLVSFLIPGITTSTAIAFPVANASGTVSTRDVTPFLVDDATQQGFYFIPQDAITGEIQLPGDLDGPIPLQIVPTLTSADLTNVNINDAFFSLTGTGFIEGAGTQYTFGSQSVIDVNASSATGDVFSSNTRSNVNLPYGEDLFGLVTVTTEGGTSAPFSIGLTQIDSVAFSGTPADSSEASANADQAVSIIGSSLSTTTDFVVRYFDVSGNLRNVLLNPVSASADGTQATLELPAFANSAFGLQAVGTSAQPLLQIVPTLSTIDVAGNDFIRIDGSGLVEGDGAYDFSGTVVTDPDASGTNVNVFTSSTRVDLSPATNFGAGDLTLTTAGGTSAALPYNFTNLNLGTLLAVEQGDNGESFVIAGSRVQRVDANGLLLQTYNNISTGFGGLSRITEELILRNSSDSTEVTLPVGTLLVLKTDDSVDALDPATGTVLASLDPGPDIISPIGLAWHPTTGTLFFLDGNTDRVIEINPATGEQLTSFPAGVDTSNGGITVASNGNLWIVGSVNNNLVELRTDGTLRQTIDLTSQGIDDELSGIDFIGDNQFVASSTRGVIYQLTTNPTTTAAAVLTDINGLAADGTPADGVQASANVGEAIELVGTNLTSATPIVFPIRNIDGSVGSVTVTPTAVNSDGTRAQVIVPDLATTGDILIGGSGSGSQLLQIVPVITGISGRQGTNGTFDLFGSGFMEGASTISTGGTVFEDVYTNPSTDDVFGARNSQYRLSLANATEGPITVTTAGGTFTFGGPSFVDPAFVDLIDVQTSTLLGSAADSGQMATHAGELITLTGRGLTNNTVVQFDAVDQNGQSGTLSRTGSASSDGTQLTIVVPAQAVTGNLRVVGDTETIIPLQIVPVLRSVGGQITAGNQIILEGVGLPEGDLTITIDGQTVLDQDVLTILERRSSQNNDAAQQVVNLTVPAGVTDGVITITTTGGTFVYDSQAINVLPEVSTSVDQGETLITALAVNLPTNSQVTLNSTIGDGGFGARDVDMFRFEADSGQRVSIDVTQLANTRFLYVRLFDSLGNELAADGFTNNNSPQLGGFTIPETGTYYVGVSGWANTDYDPTIAGSGIDGDQGRYELTIERRDAGSTRLAEITATADSGTPNNVNVAAANTGQTITLTGVGLTSNERVVFTSIDTNGDLFFRTVNPVSVASDGSSLEVVVPNDATSGVVRVLRENTGLFLQVVPTLTDVDQGAFDSFHNGNLRLTGSGFADGATTVNFGSSPLADPNQSSSVLDIFSSNTAMNVTVPNGVPSGPLSVTTLGGTSEIFGLGFDNIVSSADSGTAADGAVASANPGQAITLQGTNFDLTTDVVFFFSDSSGRRFERVVRPTAVNDDGTEIMVTVPTDAVTGPVRVVGDMNATDATLQIVPTISVADLTSVNINDAFFSLTGTGFIEGAGTQYTFGSQSVIDVNTSSATGDVFSSNTRSNVNLPYGEDLFGSVTVTTEGGTSAPFSIGLTQIDSVAFSGTAADTSEASANADQAVSIIGSDLSTATDFVVRYFDDNGNLRNVLLNPVSASADGTQATLELPAFANSAFGLQAVGASAQPLLQIVPTLSTIDVAGNDFIRIDGSGLVEGDGAYDFSGTVVTDPDASGTNVNVFTSSTRVDLSPVTNFGAGDLTLTTAGGTSAALPYNFTNLNLGTLLAVEQGDNGESFVIAGSRVQRVDANGLLLQTYNSISTSFGGLSRITEELMLRNGADITPVTLPAGTLLVLKTDDSVDALDPATDTVLATFDPSPNISSPIGLAWHPTKGTLFFLDGNTDRVIEFNPATGEQLTSFAAGVDTSNGGITVAPSGNLWIVGSVNNNLVELETGGTLLQTIDLTSQGVDRELSGIDFIDNDRFVASSTRGVIYQLTNPTAAARSRVLVMPVASTNVDEDDESAQAFFQFQTDGSLQPLAGSVELPSEQNSNWDDVFEAIAEDATDPDDIFVDDIIWSILS